MGPHPLFVSHGAPDLAIAAHPAGRFLDGLRAEFATASAVLVVSAHYQRTHPTLASRHGHRIVHDYRGFDPVLRDVSYAPPEAPELVELTETLLNRAALSFERTAMRPLDHGAWVPLVRADPEARLPVAQLSLGMGDAHAHLALGRALQPLRDAGVLVLGSGSFTHGLPDIRRWEESDAGAPDWVREFAQWSATRLDAGAESELLEWMTQAPHAQRNHPTPEHFLPLFVTMGAAGENWHAEQLHRSISREVLALDAWRFAPSAQGCSSSSGT